MNASLCQAWGTELPLLCAYLDGEELLSGSYACRDSPCGEEDAYLKPILEGNSGKENPLQLLSQPGK